MNDHGQQCQVKSVTDDSFIFYSAVDCCVTPRTISGRRCLKQSVTDYSAYNLWPMINAHFRQIRFVCGWLLCDPNPLMFDAVWCIIHLTFVAFGVWCIVFNYHLAGETKTMFDGSGWMAVSSERTDVPTKVAEARRKRAERVGDRLVYGMVSAQRFVLDTRGPSRRCH